MLDKIKTKQEKETYLNKTKNCEENTIAEVVTGVRRRYPTKTGES